ncbi:hypothetical protein J6590_023434 [Homalodisca vitripennis]|nr:hypothetical protein J6590_023434 [Homalodisca vitripennis]
MLRYICNESARGRLLRQTIGSPRGLDIPPDHPRSRGHRQDTTTSQLGDKLQLPMLRCICNESARGRLLRQTIGSPRGLDIPPDHPRSRGHRQDTTTSQLGDKLQFPMLRCICNESARGRLLRQTIASLRGLDYQFLAASHTI